MNRRIEINLITGTDKEPFVKEQEILQQNEKKRMKKERLIKIKDFQLNPLKKQLSEIQSQILSIEGTIILLEKEVDKVYKVDSQDILILKQKLDYILYLKEKIKNLQAIKKQLETQKEEIAKEIAYKNAEKKAMEKYFSLKEKSLEKKKNFKEMVEANEIFNRNSIINKF